MLLYVCILLLLLCLWLQVAVQDLVDKLRSENTTLRSELQRASESNKAAVALREDVGKELCGTGFVQFVYVYVNIYVHCTCMCVHL